SSRSTLRRLALRARVRAALKANPSTKDVDIQIDTTNGDTVLTGIVVNEQEKAEAGRVAAAVPGVGNIDNRLNLMAIRRKFTHSKTGKRIPDAAGLRRVRIPAHRPRRRRSGKVRRYAHPT